VFVTATTSHFKENRGIRGLVKQLSHHAAHPGNADTPIFFFLITRFIEELVTDYS
jgi:hypothetical protein